jgi:methyl-accepting chemotaxis protein
VLAQGIERAILETETGLLTDTFIVVMLVVFLLACILKRADKFHAYTQYVPTLLTTLGILGTFFGIVAGLLGFDVKDIDGSIGALLAGMKTAFTTSLVGMCLSVFYKILVSFGLLAPKSKLAVDEDQLGVVELYTVMTEQRDGIRALTEAIGSGDESSLMGQTKLLRSDMNDSLKDSRKEFEHFQERLWSKLQDFADMLSKSATETVIEALNNVIRDFNQNLTEQFGENFKQLNESVHKLVEWQENYKVQLGEMSEQYSHGVAAITDTEAAVAKISENTKQIPESMGQLSEVITVNQHQIDELGRHLQAFRDVRDKAVEAVPALDARIEQTLTGVESATTKLTEGLAEVTTQALTGIEGATNKLAEGLAAVTAEVVSTINNGTEQFIDGVNKSNAALVESSQAVAKDSDQIKTLFQDATSDINNSFRDMANNMDEHTKSVAENLKSSGDALVEEASRSRQSFESGLFTMREELANSLRQASEHQTQEMQRLISSVEKTMRDSINKTAESVENQVIALDQAMEHEINNSMQQMGKALASITGQFTKDYSTMVSQMQAVIQAR